MRADVGKAIDEVRAVMSDLGYLRSQYRIVLQSYPSAIARASELRVPEIDRVSAQRSRWLPGVRLRRGLG